MHPVIHSHATSVSDAAEAVRFIYETGGAGQFVCRHVCVCVCVCGKPMMYLTAVILYTDRN